jgi:putative acetyltransferase
MGAIPFTRESLVAKETIKVKSVMEIKRDDLTGAEIAELLGEHLANMAENSPPESVHALSLEQLREPDVTFWSVWDGAELLGCL